MQYTKNFPIGLVVAMSVLIALAVPELNDGVFRNLGYIQSLQGDIVGFSSLVIEQQGDSDLVMRSLLRASVLEKDFEDAETLARRFKSGIDTQLALWLLDQAAVLLDANNVPGAIVTLDLVLSHGEVDSELWYRLGSLYREAGSVDRALRVYQIGAEADSEREVPIGWCHVAITLYTMEEWQRIVDLLNPIWDAAPDSALNNPTCRTATVYLAISFQKLDRLGEAEEVYQRLVNLDPEARDWQMYNVQSRLGDVELSRGNLDPVIDHYSQAYNIALEIPAHARVDYEEKAWDGLERLAATMVGDRQAYRWFVLLRQKLGLAPDNPGLGVLWGLVCENRCDLDSAGTAYGRIKLLVADSGFIDQRLEDLSLYECSADRP